MRWGRLMNAALAAVLIGGVPLLAACQKQPPAASVAAPMSLTELQSGLKQLGYYRGAVDGVFGAGTEGAIRDFQTAQGLAPNGVRGPETEAALRRALAAPGQSLAQSQTRPQTGSATASLSTAEALVRRKFWPARLSQVDLNGDGRLDVIAAAEYSSGRCGAQACSHMVLINRGAGYETVINDLLAIEVRPGRERTKGYRDLAILAHGGDQLAGVWDGRTYVVLY